LDYEKIGLPLRVTIGVTLEPSKIQDVIEHLISINEFNIIWKTSGAHGVNIRGAFRDHAHLNKILNEALNIDGVREYHLSILDREVKNKRMI
jgi:DNA-binding Lrp family transcriptional regulator